MTYTVTEKLGKDLREGDIFWRTTQGWQKWEPGFSFAQINETTTFLVRVSPKGAEEVIDKIIQICKDHIYISCDEHEFPDIGGRAKEKILPLLAGFLPTQPQWVDAKKEMPAEGKQVLLQIWYMDGNNHKEAFEFTIGFQIADKWHFKTLYGTPVKWQYISPPTKK